MVHLLPLEKEAKLEVSSSRDGDGSRFCSWIIKPKAKQIHEQSAPMKGIELNAVYLALKKQRDSSESML